MIDLLAIQKEPKKPSLIPRTSVNKRMDDWKNQLTEEMFKFATEGVLVDCYRIDNKKWPMHLLLSSNL